MYKVFINGQPIIFSTKGFSKLNRLSLSAKDSEAKLLKIIEAMEEDETTSGVEIISDDLEKLWKNFKKHYDFIEAAGGVVFNKKRQLLAIFRLGKWDLPKGKMEKGESKEESALREVQEECGVSGLKIVKELAPVYHTYKMKGRRCLKVTYWFEMTTSFSGELRPQLEEDISQVKWVSEVNEILENTYPSLMEMLQKLDGKR